MTKEKLQLLTKYAAQIKERLGNPAPAKWAHAPDSYKAFLTRELALTQAKLNAEISK